MFCRIRIGLLHDLSPVRGDVSSDALWEAFLGSKIVCDGQDQDLDCFVT